ncbi:hydrogenase expression/formation protein HypE [Butyrivibrio sp. MC2013]|uniref:hydrogenase expression/formation protein HypE n=1 Tax=Butyrivibrio sp. MC2013 TaxID=1280686 RepID=UPI0004101B9E|nr:hydrogenase expression/formation protein HypE [Butyrivibrio sp. MC2013]
MTDKLITMAHGSGGRSTGELIKEVFAQAFDNPVLDQMEDSAVVDGAGKIAMTTDSFVVTPSVYKGGDIGRLCICGTVNDLLMRGARPKYITCGFILEEGADIELLKKVVASMAETAREASVIIVAGDTKVVEGKGEIYINTAGVGFVDEGVDISSANACPGDLIIVSGNLGDHHAAILSERMSIATSIESDNAPLTDMTLKLIDNGIRIHTLRDITRGGLGTVAKELAESSGTGFEIEENSIPVNPMVKDFCALLGLDPIYMGNEGKLLAIVDSEDADRALEIIRNSKYGENACIVGRVCADHPGQVVLNTEIGGKRFIDILQGQGLPRIC